MPLEKSQNAACWLHPRGRVRGPLPRRVTPSDSRACSLSALSRSGPVPRATVRPEMRTAELALQLAGVSGTMSTSGRDSGHERVGPCSARSGRRGDLRTVVRRGLLRKGGALERLQAEGQAPRREALVRAAIRAAAGTSGDTKRLQTPIHRRRMFPEQGVPIVRVPSARTGRWR